MTDKNRTRDPEELKYPEFIGLLGERLTHAQHAVDEEYVENDRRLNWMLLFHAFLFGAFATSLQALTGAGEKALCGDVFLARLLLTILCLVGITTAFSTIVATRAALTAIKKTKDDRARIEEEAVKHGFDGSPFGSGTSLHRFGLWPTVFAPWILLAAWIVVLLVAIDVGSAAYKPQTCHTEPSSR